MAIDGKLWDMDQRFDDMVQQVGGGAGLSREQARHAFDLIMDGQLPVEKVVEFVVYLRDKGESVEELIGAAESMRARVTRVACEADCIDTCGTGGDGISTFNVSTTAAIVAASAGAVVAKHGNQSTTRVSGSSEVLRELGIDIDAPVASVERDLREHGIGYLNARVLHPAMRHAVPVRAAIPTRTIFNLLGPLTNPAGAKRQLLGVPHESLMEKMALVLQSLGAVHVWMVHGGDGLCDLTATTTTKVIELKDGQLRAFEISPEMVGLARCGLDELCVSTPQASARVVLDVLSGASGGPRDHTLLNSGAALVVAGVVDDLQEGVARSKQAIDSGAAMATLEHWRPRSS